MLRRFTVLLAVGLVAAGMAPARAATFDVDVRSNFFNPAVVHASAADTIRWTVTAGGHDVVSYSGPQEFASDLMTPGDPPFTQVFGGGTVLYRCQLHSSLNAGGTCNGMCGSITDQFGTPATPSITTPSPDSTVTQNPAGFTGGGQPGTTVRLTEGAPMLGEAIVSASGTWSVGVLLSDGPHTVTAQAFSVDGVAGGTVSVSFTVSAGPPDTVAPTARVSTANPSVFTGTVTIRGSASDDRGVAGIQLWFFDALGQFKTAVNATCTSCPAASTLWTATATPGPGVYSVYAIARDTAFVPNESARSNTITIVTL